MIRRGSFSELDEDIFSRSYLVTLGGLFAVISVFVVSLLDSSQHIEYVIMSVIISLGLICICVGVFFSSQKAKAFAESASKHEVCVVILFLSMPLYWIWTKLRRMTSR